MYLCHVAFGLDYSAVGRAFRRDRTTVRHACRVIEDSRDAASTDLLLMRLEWASRIFAASLPNAISVPTSMPCQKPDGVLQ